MRLNDSEEKIRKTGCIYRPRGVICTKKDHCEVCGWNPKVERIKKKLIRMARHESNKRTNLTGTRCC